jgi:hypothetical protein
MLWQKAEDLRVREEALLSREEAVRQREEKVQRVCHLPNVRAKIRVAHFWSEFLLFCRRRGASPSLRAATSRIAATSRHSLVAI